MDESSTACPDLSNNLAGAFQETWRELSPFVHLITGPPWADSEVAPHLNPILVSHGPGDSLIHAGTIQAYEVISR